MSTVAATHPEIVERQRRITVGEYHRMIEAGILGEDEHVQLIAGTLVAMTPQGSRHAVVIQRLTAALVRAVGGDLAVRPQLPLTLLEDSEPEPDLAVVRAADAPFDGPHPRGALLVVEVAGDSLRLDRESKATLYARAGIPEYWIVNLAESAIEAHSEPDRATGVYRSSAVVACGETLVARSVPNLTIDVASLFG
jgi:Uma2 family endonuclease